MKCRVTHVSSLVQLGHLTCASSHGTVFLGEHKGETHSPPRPHLSIFSVPKYLFYGGWRKLWFIPQWICVCWWSTGITQVSFLPALHKAGGKDSQRPRLLTRDHGKFKPFTNIDLCFPWDVCFSSRVFLCLSFCFHYLFLSWVLGQKYHSLKNKSKFCSFYSSPVSSSPRSMKQTFHNKTSF